MTYCAKTCHITLVAIALGAVLLAYGEPATLAALCVLYIGIIAWNWRQARR